MNHQVSTNTQNSHVDADGYAGAYNAHDSYHLIIPLSPTLIPLPSILMAAPFIESLNLPFTMQPNHDTSVVVVELIF